MKLSTGLLLAGAWAGLTSSLHADLSNFTDYQLGGVSASFDIWYGDNYLQQFSYDSGTAGNPLLGSQSTITLIADVPNWVDSGPASPAAPQFGNATGPIGSGGLQAGVPGNREQFYTLWGNPVDFSIAGATETPWETVALQLNGSAISNPLLNGLAPTSFTYDEDSEYGVAMWQGLGYAQGTNYSLNWSAGGQHHAYDALQLQAGPQAIPEPATIALVLLGAAVFTFYRLRRRHA